MAKNLRAVVTVQKAQVTTSYVKDEAVTSYQRAEAIAFRSDFSINQWYYDYWTAEAASAELPNNILLEELFVSVLLKNVAESVELIEVPALAFNKLTTETLSLLETFARVVTWNRSFTDAFTLDDAAQIEKDYYGNKGNVAFMLDILGINLNRPVTDSYTVGDVYTAAINKVVTENLSLIETQVRSFNIAKTDSFLIAENFSIERGLTKSDSISFSDIYYATLSKIVTESVTMTEVIGIGTGIPITELFSISDSIISEINKVIADAFTLDDSALIDKDYYGAKGNICTVSDVIALAITWVRGYSDSISTSDSANIANISGKVLNGAFFNRITLN